MTALLSVLLGLALLAARAKAACVCLGLDYTNAGSYFIDDTSDESFSFLSEFRGREPRIPRVDGNRILTETRMRE